jgi:hypothetical protein
MDALDFTTVSGAIYRWVIDGSGLANDHVFWAFEGKPRPTAPYIEMSIQSIRPIGHDWTTSEGNPLVLPTQTIQSIDPVGNAITIPGHPYLNGDGPVQLVSTGTLPTPILAATNYWIIVVDVNTIQLAATYVNTGGAQPAGSTNPKTSIVLSDAGSGTITVNVTANTVRAGQEIIRRAQGFREMILHFECIARDGGGYDAMRIMSNVMASLQLHLYDLDQSGVGVSDMGQGFSQGGVQSLEGRRGGILEPRSMVDVTIYLASDLTGLETIIESVNANIVLDSEGDIPLPPIPIHIP